MRSLLVLLILIIIFDYGYGQQPGCTDPLATNYNSSAEINDGSCVYPQTTIQPYASNQLSDDIEETSGLIWWNGSFWTHNDNSDTRLYAIDSSNGVISQSVAIAQAGNQDWEELAQDDQYLYIGDFGNNGNGNRQNLHIVRVLKSSLTTGPVRDTIFFSYEDQTDFTGTGPNATNYDCEAFIVSNDSIYLFTKRWVDKKCFLYALPLTPGIYTAKLLDSLNAGGLITGASYLKDKRVVVLSGYGFFAPPFVYLLYDYQGHDFFGGNKRKIQVGQALSQVEGIATVDGQTYYLTNEKLSNRLATIQPQLRRLNLAPFLEQYYQTGLTQTLRKNGTGSLKLYPNPATGLIGLGIEAEDADLVRMEFRNLTGKLFWSETRQLQKGLNHVTLELPDLEVGVYFLTVKGSSLNLKQQLIFQGY